MSCPEHSEALNAMLDGELPASEMAVLAQHLSGCPACTRHLAELAALRAALQEEWAREAVSPAFEAKIVGLIDAHAVSPSAQILPFKPRRTVLPWLSAGAAIAAMLAVTLFPHRDNSKDLMSVRDAALRAATGPQIAADATAPALPGFRLAATRTDIVAGHPAKVLHYTLANQNVTLCVWPAGSEPRHGIRTARYEGMSIDYWNDGTQEYWAITDGPPSALKKFISEYKES